MNKIKKILHLVRDEIIHGGHILSLGAVSIIFTSAILLGIRITWDCLLVAYLGCQIIYLYNRYKEFDKDFLTNLKRTQHISKYMKYIPLAIFISSLIIFSVFVYFQKFLALTFSLFLIFLGILYSLFLKKITQKIIGFKNFFVSFCWALLVIFVYLFYSYNWNLSFLLVFIFVWISVFIQEVLLDIKDIKGDQKENLLTLPLIFNKKLLSYILALLTILADIPIFYGVYSRLLPIYSLALVFIIPYNFFLLKNINQIYKNPKYIEQLINGQKILYGILVFMFYKL